MVNIMGFTKLWYFGPAHLLIIAQKHLKNYSNISVTQKTKNDKVILIIDRGLEEMNKIISKTHIWSGQQAELSS